MLRRTNTNAGWQQRSVLAVLANNHATTPDESNTVFRHVLANEDTLTLDDRK